MVPDERRLREGRAALERSGATAGGESGLGPKEIAQLEALGAGLASEPGCVVLASARNWNGTAPGWEIPPGVQTAVHYPVVRALVPACALVDGGWVRVRASGYFRPGLRGPSVHILLARLDLNGEYFGPRWTDFADGPDEEQGWGWHGQAPSENRHLVDPVDWVFDVDLISLGEPARRDAAGANVRMLAVGAFRGWHADSVPWLDEGEPGQVSAYHRPVFFKGTADPTRDLELQLAFAQPRLDPGDNTRDELHVHGADVLLFAPRADHPLDGAPRMSGIPAI